MTCQARGPHCPICREQVPVSSSSLPKSSQSFWQQQEEPAFAVESIGHSAVALRSVCIRACVLYLLSCLPVCTFASLPWSIATYGYHSLIITMYRRTQCINNTICRVCSAGRVYPHDSANGHDTYRNGQDVCVLICSALQKKRTLAVTFTVRDQMDQISVSSARRVHLRLRLQIQCMNVLDLFPAQGVKTWDNARNQDCIADSNYLFCRKLVPSLSRSGLQYTHVLDFFPLQETCTLTVLLTAAVFMYTVLNLFPLQETFTLTVPLTAPIYLCWISFLCNKRFVFRSSLRPRHVHMIDFSHQQELYALAVKFTDTT